MPSIGVNVEIMWALYVNGVPVMFGDDFPDTDDDEWQWLSHLLSEGAAYFGQWSRSLHPLTGDMLQTSLAMFEDICAPLMHGAHVLGDWAPSPQNGVAFSTEDDDEVRDEDDDMPHHDDCECIECHPEPEMSIPLVSPEIEAALRSAERPLQTSAAAPSDREQCAAWHMDGNGIEWRCVRWVGHTLDGVGHRDSEGAHWGGAQSIPSTMPSEDEQCDAWHEGMRANGDRFGARCIGYLDHDDAHIDANGNRWHNEAHDAGAERVTPESVRTGAERWLDEHAPVLSMHERETVRIPTAGDFALIEPGVPESRACPSCRGAGVHTDMGTLDEPRNETCHTCSGLGFVSRDHNDLTGTWARRMILGDITDDTPPALTDLPLVERQSTDISHLVESITVRDRDGNTIMSTDPNDASNRPLQVRRVTSDNAVRFAETLPTVAHYTGTPLAHLTMHEDGTIEQNVAVSLGNDGSSEPIRPARRTTIERGLLSPDAFEPRWAGG